MGWKGEGVGLGKGRNVWGWLGGIWRGFGSGDGEYGVDLSFDLEVEV